MNALLPVRFVTRRTTELRDTPYGPRVHVIERWTDGTTRHRDMGPKETAVHLRNQQRKAGETS